MMIASFHHIGHDSKSNIYKYKSPVLDTPAGAGGAGAEAVVAGPSGISTSINRLGSSVVNVK
jgi:hypothetical protein